MSLLNCGPDSLLHIAPRKEWNDAIPLTLQTTLLLATPESFVWTIKRALTSHLVGLLLQSPKEGPLFRGQHTADSDFSQDSHSHSRCLSGGRFPHSLFYDSFVGAVRVQNYFEGPAGLADAFIDSRAFFLILLTYRSYLFALFRRQI